MKTITVRNAYRFTLLCLVVLAGIAQAEIETITYLHSDHLGSPVLARDNQGNTLWREDYSPWGERLTRPSGNSADIGYTGHYEETDIGLTYAQARWYDPQVGRFLAADAVDFTGGGAAHFNRYGYANSNPYRFVDPDGRDSRAAAFAALGDVDYNARGANAAQGVANGMAAFGDAVDYAVEPSAASFFGGVLGKLGLRVLSGVTKKAPDITTPYKRPSGATTKAQRESVQNQPCVDCGNIANRQVADHKNPLVKEYYETGTIDKAKMRSVDAVQPQCPTCSARQGAEMSRYSKQQKKDLGL